MRFPPNAPKPGATLQSQVPQPRLDQRLFCSAPPAPANPRREIRLADPAELRCKDADRRKAFGAGASEERNSSGKARLSATACRNSNKAQRRPGTRREVRKFRPAIYGILRTTAPGEGSSASAVGSSSM
jgi:hypothetical protein